MLMDFFFIIFLYPRLYSPLFTVLFYSFFALIHPIFQFYLFVLTLGIHFHIKTRCVLTIINDTNLSYKIRSVKTL